MSNRHVGWRIPAALLSGLCLAALSACGGGGGGATPASAPPAPAPAPPSPPPSSPPVPETSASIKPPTITLAADGTTFSVDSSGSGPLSYQWTLNHAPIEGATGATYTRTAMSASDNAAVLRVNASGPAGSGESNGIALTVNGIGSRPFAGALGVKPIVLLANPAFNFTSLAVDADGTHYGIEGKSLWKGGPKREWTQLGSNVCANEGRIALDKDRNIYTGCGNHVLKLTAAGVLSTYAGSKLDLGSTDGPGDSARFASISAVAVDASGVVYVGDPGNGAVRRIGLDRVVTTLAGADKVGTPLDGTGAAARFGAVRSLALDTAGNLFVGDKTSIRKITPAGKVSTLAGDALASGAANGSGAGARFDSPAGIVLDADGTLFVADKGNRSIRKVSSAGLVSTIAGSVFLPGSSDGFGNMARFTAPIAISIDNAGMLYVADNPAGIVRKVTRAGAVSTVMGAPRVSMVAGSLDGIGQEALFNEPTRMGTDAAGNVYVLDSKNYTIRKIMPGGVVSTLAGTPGVSGEADGRGADARLRDPAAMAVAGDGTVYLLDSKAALANRYLRKMTPDGVVSTVEVPADPVLATLGAPVHPPQHVAIAADRSGNYYIASLWSFKAACADAPARDTCGKRARATIRKISPAGVATTLTTWEDIYAGKPSMQATFMPTAMAADSDGNVYILDQSNLTVMKVSPNGKSSPLVASKITCAGDAFRKTCLNEPNAMAVDAAGRVYVVNRYSSVVLMFTPDGVGKLIAGNYTYSDLDYTLALGPLPGGLSGLAGITATSDSTLYVTVHSGVIKIVHE
ncbi:hypothetical protein F2P44_14150 [Massilia sp. CCM 8695]|uniref:Uncharacterized protein n=1 Tax=Massilia frigida TaxID=2609281 RepID=A0ABX0ND34_9BURK|nr:hypothetical protein [Massilia frigida]NHZ80406.1 hypothetical protein [Massilia frigida]